MIKVDHVWDPEATGIEVRVRGLVQGVGFRPTVWRHATALGLAGEVLNDGEGVLIRAFGPRPALTRFVQQVRQHPPRLARIDDLEVRALVTGRAPSGFRIVASHATGAATPVLPDAATCADCLRDILDPAGRRRGYPFTNCTSCGPRFSIVREVPYDRAKTTMAAFLMCADCQGEYDAPGDRRFHAQPNACARCGPRVTLERSGRERLDVIDPVAAAARLLREGAIVAIKGLGGYHLACDATSEAAVRRLRERKHRPSKPLALMARDAEVIARYCRVEDAEREALQSPQAPIVLLEAAGPDRVAASVAPDAVELGFMLPYTPLHHLLFTELDVPLVMTSGNLSESPQVTGDDDARDRLGGIADTFLCHDRPIASRIDDSIVRVLDDVPRLLRRARGYAPAPLRLPDGFETAPRILGYGAVLKSTFCLLDGRGATLSQHLGDLTDAETRRDYRHHLDHYAALFGHVPEVLAVDGHPDYPSTRLGRERAARAGLPLERVQHHHAHLAACLFEHGVPLDHGPVLGLVLDGLGYGDDGELWGGELFAGGYAEVRRLARLAPVPLLGGEQAMLEPWRSTFAHLATSIGLDPLLSENTDLPLVRELAEKPVQLLARMMTTGHRSPSASSAGRLFDAVAGAVGLCRERVTFEGEAAMALEAAADPALIGPDGPVYPFARRRDGDLVTLDAAPMWRALLRDLRYGEAAGTISARFHNGFARAVVEIVRVAGGPLRTIAVTGGVFQNRLLLAAVTSALEQAGYRVLTHRQVPPNDGGIALGQVAVAAARHAKGRRT